VLRNRSKDSEPDRLRAEATRGRANFHFSFTRQSAAAALWDYGEDESSARVLTVSDSDLLLIQNIASVYEDRSYPLPVDGRITHNHVMALAAISFFDRLRPLSRTRRRPEKQRPLALSADALQAARIAAYGQPRAEG
jgi:hypothetical protein